jgi:hypothetical protein
VTRLRHLAERYLYDFSLVRLCAAEILGPGPAIFGGGPVAGPSAAFRHCSDTSNAWTSLFGVSKPTSTDPFAASLA